MHEHEKVNILMVGDQPAKLLGYEAILRELGENLIKASSGRQALKYLLKTDIAVVLMDVSLPELDGFELAKRIHFRGYHDHIARPACIEWTAQHGASGYHIKAIDYTQFRDEIRQLIASCLGSHLLSPNWH